MTFEIFKKKIIDSNIFDYVSTKEEHNDGGTTVGIKYKNFQGTLTYNPSIDYVSCNIELGKFNQKNKKAFKDIEKFRKNKPQYVDLNVKSSGPVDWVAYIWFFVPSSMYVEDPIQEFINVFPETMNELKIKLASVLSSIS